MQITSLKIGPRTYSVHEVPRDILPDRAVGEFCVFDGKILIAEDNVKDFKAEILIHEVLHALFFDAGLLLDADREETLVQALSPRLAAFLGDNPNEVRELLRRLKC